MKHIVHVGTEKPYDALIGTRLLEDAGAILSAHTKARKIALISDDVVAGLYLETVRQSLSHSGFEVAPFCFPAGEPSKSLDVLQKLYAHLARHQITRGDMLLALGGGVVGDLVGFAAATWLRGVPFAQMPTTLLAAVDASVGGKTAVNLPEGKNLVGAFWQPSLVLCDCGTFDTLPAAVFADGIAESLKHGVLRDRELFELTKNGGARKDAASLVARNMRIKAEFVLEDERDVGRRQLLNFGHTIGHAIETLSGLSIPHGHAVAIGMASMARAAERLSLCEMPLAAEIEAALIQCGLPTRSPYPTDALVEAALRDKKRSAGTITLVMPKRIGECVLHAVPIEELPDIFKLGEGMAP